MMIDDDEILLGKVEGTLPYICCVSDVHDVTNYMQHYYCYCYVATQILKAF